MSRFYQDLDYPHYDYDLAKCAGLTGRELRGPVPNLNEPYFVCVGAAQTFGRFCADPFPSQLSRKLSLPVLNLGLAGAGPRAFLNSEILALINRSEFAIIQVLSGRSESNSAFDNAETGATHGVRLRDQKRMRFEEFIEQEMASSPREVVQQLINETRENWVARYQRLLGAIAVPKVLLWLSTVAPDRTDDYSIWWNLLGPFPQLVNRSMINQIRPDCDIYVESVCQLGLPQPLWRSSDQIDGTELREGRLVNTYYPSPKMHEVAAQDLFSACKSLLAELKDRPRMPLLAKSGVETETALQDRVSRSMELLAVGDREAALEEARKAVQSHSSSAAAQRALSYSLTYRDNFCHDKHLCSRLIEDGSIAQALAAAQSAARLRDANYEDFLQAGYCLTALGAFELATKFIRNATDIFSAISHPRLFEDMDENWVPLHPTFLVIGVAKAGTTSLSHYISCHSRVLSPVTKEVNYFGAPERGFGWYLAHFPRRPPGERYFISGEARVGNFENWLAPELVKKSLPGVRLIAVLRDPVERAISHYYNDKRVGTETRSLRQAMDEELSYLDCPDDRLDTNLHDYYVSQRSYLSAGLYARHLSNWMRSFTAEEILIVVSEELNSDPDLQMRRVFQHLGLNYEELDEYPNKLAGTYDQQSRDEIRAKLVRFFEAHNERLYGLLNRRLNWQSASTVRT